MKLLVIQKCHNVCEHTCAPKQINKYQKHLLKQNTSHYLLQNFSQCFQISNKLLGFCTELMPYGINKHTNHSVKVLCNCRLNCNLIRIQLQQQQ